VKACADYFHDQAETIGSYDLDALADASDVDFNIRWDSFSNASLPDTNLCQATTVPTSGGLTPVLSPPSLDSSSFLPLEKITDHPVSMVTSPRLSEHGDTEMQDTRHEGLSMSTWVSKVAEINISLLNLSAHVRGQDTPPTSQFPAAEMERVFAIDQAFLLSQQLIDLLNQVFPRFVDRSSHGRRSSVASSSSSNNNNKNIDTTKPIIPIRTLDPASNLLVLSCHLRVLEIYGKIFRRIESSIKQQQQQLRTPVEQIRLPGLTIGVFSLQSSCGLQITVIIQLAKILLSRLRDIMNLMDTTTSSNTQDSDPSASLNEVADITLQAIKAREIETIKIVVRVKRSLEQSGML
jgi:hypothetical protein